MSEENNDLMEKIISLSKRRGFIYQGSEIYGGLAGTWDYGPNGIELKNNLMKLWWRKFVTLRPDIYGIDGSILMNPRVWEASGHTTGFNDPMIEDEKTGEKIRMDNLLEENNVNPIGMTLDEMWAKIKKENIKSPKGNNLKEPQLFNMMFETNIGASKDSASKTYLRPETAGAIFTNYKNVLDTFHPEIPFGIAQIGKAFRNEIAPRDFIFRTREFEQMEIEYFVREDEWEKHFEDWRNNLKDFNRAIGLNESMVSEHDIEKEDLAHYSTKTIDFEFDYPFGKKELYGLAYRTDHDLKSHSDVSGEKLEYFDQQRGERFIPHVIEPSLGIERLILALLLGAYNEENVGDEERVVMKFEYDIAPVKIAVLPLMRKDGMPEKGKEIFDGLVKSWNVQYDETASIGKRYRRQDEIGTPYCVTIDHQTLEDDAVTVRDRDTMEQERVSISDLNSYFKEKFN